MLNNEDRTTIEKHILKSVRRARFALSKAIRFTSKMQRYGDTRLEAYMEVMKEIHAHVSRVEAQYEDTFGWKLDPVLSICNKSGKSEGDEDILDYNEMLTKMKRRKAQGLPPGRDLNPWELEEKRLRKKKEPKVKTELDEEREAEAREMGLSEEEIEALMDELND
jgi:hypothetical protein